MDGYTSIQDDGGGGVIGIGMVDNPEPRVGSRTDGSTPSSTNRILLFLSLSWLLRASPRYKVWTCGRPSDRIYVTSPALLIPTSTSRQSTSTTSTSTSTLDLKPGAGRDETRRDETERDSWALRFDVIRSTRFFRFSCFFFFSHGYDLWAFFSIISF